MQNPNRLYPYQLEKEKVIEVDLTRQEREWLKEARKSHMVTDQVI
jgi:hypothetical protein